MKPLIELYTLADPVFFEDPVRWRPEEPAFDVDTPDGWKRGGTDGWVMLRPLGSQLPDQGWKIHVSATPGNAASTVDKVARYCFDQAIAFKFLETPGLVRAFSLKYAPRASSGKVMALYPRDEDELRRCLEDLDSALAGTEGPYILSDLRYREGPLYVRYGGFARRYCSADDGEWVLAISRPDGTLVPDERKPVFSVPDWVELPDFLAESLTARKQAGITFGYQVTEALHFSNGGGVYVANRLSDGLEVVLKEGRPHAGLSGGKDAVGRLDQEVWALRRLDGTPGVPRVHDVFTVAGHRFVAMDRIAGHTLQHWLALNFPLIGASATMAERRDYAERALRLADQVTRLIQRVHDRGIVFSDLHPANVLVDDDENVGLIDFEAAFEASEARRQPMGHAGFTAGDKTGRDIDLHALAVLKLWLFMPLTSLLGLAPGKVDHLAEQAGHLFGLPPEFVEEMKAGIAGARTSVSPVGTADWPAAFGPKALGSMVQAIHASATPDRVDRLFPGDIGAFATGGANFAYGAAGVLWALAMTGFEIKPSYEKWLCARAAEPVERPGFFDGAHGVAHVLDLLGHHSLADDLIRRSAAQVADLADVTLFSGLAGVGLNLVHLAGKSGKHSNDGYLSLACELGSRVGAAILDGRPHGIDKPPGVLGRARDSGTHGGLLRGWSGPALFLLRLYEATRDEQWLELAVRAVHRDLDLCVTALDGSLQVDGGFRTLPYLDVGSAGIVIVADEIIGHVADTRILDSVEPLARACASVFVMESQLFNGRAGLLAVLSGLSRNGSANIVAEQVRGHLENLSWHALGFHGHVSFPGDGCSRLSMDFSTGTAGVLAAVASVHDSSIPFFPFLSRGMSVGQGLTGMKGVPQ